MAKQSLGYLSYFQDIVSGKINACKKMKLVSERILKDLANKNSQWKYDAEEAANHIEFIEAFCNQPVGRLKPLVLEPFQKAILATAYGFVDSDGNRKYQEVLIVIGRKNGKTTLCAAICFDLLLNTEEYSPEIYNAATSKDQSNKCFNACLTMLETSKSLKKHARKRVSDIFCDANRGFIKSLASNTNALDGLDVQGAVIDELAAHKNRDVYDLIIQAIGSRDNPLVFEITTNGFVREGIFDSQYKAATKWLNGESEDEGFIPFIYELDEDSEWEDESCWVKANPGLGSIKKLSYQKRMIAKVKDDPSFLATVLTKDFNRKANDSSAWLNWSEIENKELFDLKKGDFSYGIGGIDAADSVDLSAACVILMRKDDPKMYKISMYWIPQTVLDQQTTDGNRRERDSVPYTEWVKRGLMRTFPGNKVDKRVFLEWFIEIQKEFGIYYHAIGYDKWHMTDDSIRTSFEQFLGEDNFEEVIQGAKTMSDPMKDFRADLEAGLVVNNTNPVDNWCRANGAIRTDINGNIQLDKKNNDPRNRIDGLVAELNAYIVLKRRWESYSSIIK